MDCLLIHWDVRMVQNHGDAIAMDCLLIHWDVRMVQNHGDAIALEWIGRRFEVILWQKPIE
jgi:hypothetical protein